MTNPNLIVDRVDAAIKRCGSDLPELDLELRHLTDKFGERAVLMALSQCAAIAYMRLANTGGRH